MEYNVELNKQNLKNHFSYDWWKYIVCIISIIFIWNMVETVTAPRTPNDKKVDIYMVGEYADTEKLNYLSENMLQQFPELLEINFNNIQKGGDSQMDYAGTQKLAVMLGAQEGDVYIFNKEDFQRYVQQGAFIPLDDIIDSSVIESIPEEKREEFTSTIEDGENIEWENTPHLYGLPMEGISCFEESLYPVEDKVIGIIAFCHNEEYSKKVIEWLFEECKN